MAFLIALEGIDGSGKGTQAHRLQARLIATGRRVQLIGFPRYEATLFGRSIGEFLNGRFGELDEVHPFLAALLYAGDRFESRGDLLDALAGNDVVVCDRYIPSNMAHQGAKLAGAERAEFVEWLRQIEYGIYALPRPDLVVLLDLPAREAQRLIGLKQKRTYTDRQADLQEADAGYLEQVRQVYLELSRESENWHRIDCFAGNELRSIDEVGELVWAAAMQGLGQCENAEFRIQNSGEEL